MSLHSDGLIGLAPNTPPNVQYNTLITELFNQKIIKNNMFSLYLSKTGVQSKIWLGGYDPTYVRSALASSVPFDKLNATND